MAKKTPDQISEKYQRGVAGAGADYAAGVQNPARPWASATAAGQKRWAAGIQKAIAEGKFARGVQAAGDAKWQQNALNKGAQRYQASAQEAAAGYQKVAARIMQAGQAAQSAVANMDNSTQEARIARSAAAQRAISQAWSSGK